MSKGLAAPTRDGAKTTLRVSPGARRTAIAYGEDAIKLRVAAPPVDGKANAEAERHVAELLGVTASDVSIVGGVLGLDKTMLVRGVGAEEAHEIFAARLS